MTLSFVGMGNMAYAIARGLLEAGALKGEQVSAYDPNPQKARTLEQDFGVRCLEELGQAAKADLVVLAVKPNVIEQVVGELKSLLEGKALQRARRRFAGFGASSLGHAQHPHAGRRGHVHFRKKAHADTKRARRRARPV